MLGVLNQVKRGIATVAYGFHLFFRKAPYERHFYRRQDWSKALSASKAFSWLPTCQALVMEVLAIGIHGPICLTPNEEEEQNLPAFPFFIK
jgi:hypothetical protein